jgi:hypothetical protein
MRVNYKNYALFEYSEFLDRGQEADRPESTEYELGDVVYIKRENAIGVVLGCIDNGFGELRTDMSGMVAFDDIEPAAFEHFKRPGVRFVEQLLRELVVANEKPDMVPGGWTPQTGDFEFSPRQQPSPGAKSVPVPGVPNAFVLRGVLSDEDCARLVDMFMSSGISAPVSVQGRKDVPDDRVGSVRATAWAPDLADKLWQKMLTLVRPRTRVMSDTTSTDWWQGDKERRDWKSVGLTPMLRFMRYEDGGQHYAHYDAGYIYGADDRYRTLMSFVLYLTTNTEGGATRFIRDGQADKPVYERSHEDWTREVMPEEVIAANYPVAGDILIFDHRACHDVQAYHGRGPRIIVRGDILFTNIDAAVI